MLDLTVERLTRVPGRWLSPHVEKRLLEECASVGMVDSASAVGLLRYEVLMGMHYLAAVVKETLRARTLTSSAATAGIACCC